MDSGTPTYAGYAPAQGERDGMVMVGLRDGLVLI